MRAASRTILGVVTAVLVLMNFGACTTKSVARQVRSGPSINHQLLYDLMSEYDIPGVAVAVSHKGEDQFGNYGSADLTSGSAVTPDTLFEIGSVSKLFTATSAALAEQEGLISLSAPIGDYLPELAETPLGDVAVLHLSTHTAGGFPLQLPDYVDSGGALVQYYRDWVPEFPVGVYRHYANPSIGLLSLIVARTRGMSFAELMEQDLFPSIGMDHTFINVPENEQCNYAWGHNRNGERVRINPAVLDDEAYGVKTTSLDLLEFLKINIGCNAHSLGLQGAACRTHTSWFDTGMFHQAMIWEKYEYPIDLDELHSGNSYEVILGATPVFDVTRVQDNQVYVLSKTGSTGGFGSYVFVVPHEELAIVLLANKNIPIQARIDTVYQLAADFLGPTMGAAP